MSKVRRRSKKGTSKKPVHSQRHPQRGKEQKTSQSYLPVFFVCGVLIVTTLVVYWGWWQFDFVNIDDNEYVTENLGVIGGVNWEGVKWVFTKSCAGNWHPLTGLSHMLDCELYGLKPAGHHFTNILFHIANSLLLFWVFWRMTGNLWPSAFVAALFALHPLHVESVAWVSERKDVLSTFFWLLTMLAYLGYVRRPRLGMYILALLAFAAGFMAKPMLVTLPFVLLLLDFWPLDRMQLGQVGSPEKKSIITLVKEKIPFFVLTGVFCVITVFAQQGDEAVKDFSMLPLKYRIGNGIISYFAYIWKMFVPVNLSVYYPHPGDGLQWNRVVLAGLLLTAIFALIIIRGRRRGWLIVGWLWYVGTLVPVIGLIQVGTQAMADRYTYVPLIGLFIIVAWALSELAAKWRYRKIALGVSCAVVLAVLMICARQQVGYWRNSITLFEQAIAATGDNYRAQYNLASAYAKIGRIDKAVEHNAEAVRLEPTSPEAHYNLGVQLFKQGKTDVAVTHYKQAILLDPGLAKAHNSLGIAFEMQGQLDDALMCYSEAISLKPDYANAYFGLASVLTKQGKKAEAIAAFREVLRIEPENFMAKQELEKLLNKQSD